MKTQVISFNCVLKNKTGQLISTTFNREVLNSTAGSDSILIGLANGLQNLRKGEKRSISLSAEEAYGLYDPKKVIFFPKKKIPQAVRVGETISLSGKSGNVRLYKVIQMHDEMVCLDGNHPLAGQDLIFEIEAIEARDATSKEIDDSSATLSSSYLN